MPKDNQCPKAVTKKTRLTLSELASYDDICTDALVDHVFFWSKIRKNRTKYNSGRGFSEDAVVKILFDHVIDDENEKVAEAKLLELSGFKKFLGRLRTNREQVDFRKHLRRYMSIWLQDCPWEVTTTNRYTVTTHEASVSARRVIKKGETIKYLCGTMVEMTREEEKDLDLTRRDFSIVTSSRNKKTSLFLGPARFANHDCKANARLTTSGTTGMTVVATRIIELGEEITVTYGDDYFGENNSECLCGSCEQAGIGGWTRSRDSSCAETPSSSAEPYSFRRTRQHRRLSNSPTTPVPETFVGASRRRSSTGHRTPPMSPTPPRGRSVRTSLARVSSALARYSPELVDAVAVEDDHIVDDSCTAPGDPQDGVLGAPPLLVTTEAEFKHDLGVTSPAEQGSDSIKEEDVNNNANIVPMGRCPKRPLTPDEEDEDVQSNKRIRLSAAGSAPESPKLVQQSASCNANEKTIPPRELLVGVDETTQINNEHTLKRKRASSSPESLFDGNHTEQVGTPLSSPSVGLLDIQPSVKLEEATKDITSITPDVQLQDMEEDSELSEMEADEIFDDVNLQIIRRKKIKAKSKKSTRYLQVVEEPDVHRTRYPGDYTNTTILLSEPSSRWVQCKTCSGIWVQNEGRQTRRECPRCERHSQLYGYQYPKVYDEEQERTADRRAIDRFLSPSEEYRLRKRARLI